MKNNAPYYHDTTGYGIAVIIGVVLLTIGGYLLLEKSERELDLSGPHATMTALQGTQDVLSSTQDAIDGELYEIRQSVALTHEASVAERIRDLFASMTETPPPTPERITMTHGYRK